MFNKCICPVSEMNNLSCSYWILKEGKISLFIAIDSKVNLLHMFSSNQDFGISSINPRRVFFFRFIILTTCISVLCAWVSVYVCVYECLYVYVCARVHVCVCICMRMCTWVQVPLQAQESDPRSWSHMTGCWVVFALNHWAIHPEPSSDM